MNIGTLTVTMGVDTAGLVAANTAMQKFQKNTVTSLNTMSQRFRTFGYLATATLTVPIVAAGKAMFKMAQDYEASLSKVIGLVGVAREQVNEWGSEILQMAPEVAKSPKELADALYFITSAGIRGAEAMDVLEMSAKASAAGLGETKIVADLVTSAMNAYGIVNLSAAQATDVLTATVREGKAEATALASTMGMVLPIASAMGVSFDQVGAGIAAMTRTGTSAATASMQLRQILNSLVKPAQQSEKALELMGTSSAALRKTIKEDGLLKALMDIKNLTNKYGEEVMARVFPNIRALSGVLDIMGANLEDNVKIFNSISNASGSASRAFSTVSETIKFRFNAALSKAQVTMTDLGKTVAETIIPIFEKYVKKLDNLAKWFDSLSEAEKRQKLNIVLLVAALGPASMALSILGYTLSGLITFLGGVGTAIKIWNSQLIISRIAANATTISIGSMSIAIESVGAAALTAAAAVGKFILVSAGIAVIFTAAWPLVQKLIDKIKDLKRQIAEAKEVLGYTTPSMELDVSIGKNMAVLNKLNQSELESTKRMIAERIALERERLLNAERTGLKEIQNEQFVLNEKKKIFESTARWETIKKQYAQGSIFPQDYKMFGQNISFEIQRANKAIDEYIKNRQAEVAYDKMAAEDTIDFYNQQSNKVETELQKISKSVKTTNEDIEKMMNVHRLILDQYQSELKAMASENKLNQLLKGLEAKQPIDFRKFFFNTAGLNDGQAVATTILENWYARGLISNKEYLDAKFEADIMNAKNDADAKLKIETQHLRDIKALRLQNAQSYIQSTATALNAISDLIESSKQKELSAVGDNAKARKRIEKEYLAKQKAWAVSQAIINGALAITNLLASAPGGVLNPATWIAMGVTAASTAAQVALISAQGLANGGIIPPGYPNDTYPALLSSGEKVIPAPLSLNNGMQGKVVFEIHQDVLRGILDKADIKNSLY